MRRTEHHTRERPESTRGDVEVINAQSFLGGTEPHTEPENIHAHATMHVDSHTDSSSEETPGDTHMHAQPNSDTSSEESEPLLTHIPPGPNATPQHVSEVWAWWETEIWPWRATILGTHEARRVQHMDIVNRWYFVKYRFDFHMHYQPHVEPPPPQPMWQDNVLHLQSPEAQAWTHRQDILEMQVATSSDSD